MDVVKCGQCRKMVTPEQEVTFMGKSWHRECLRCTTCATKLSDKNGECYEGRFYCRVHWPLASRSSILVDDSSIVRSNHRVVLYVDAKRGNIYSIRKIMETIKFFSEKGISDRQILMINVSDDRVRQEWLREQNPRTRSFEYPQIYIGDIRVGTLDDLHYSSSTGQLDKLLSQNLTSSLTLSLNAAKGGESPVPQREEQPEEEQPPAGGAGECLPPEVQLGYVDTWINGAEWVVKGLLGGVWDASAYMIGAKSTEPAPPRPVAEDPTAVTVGMKVPEKVEVEGVVDFPCIRTNWYWRHQKRVYRFTPKNWYRIDPTLLVKDVFSYQDVKSIIETDQLNMIISFESRKEPQYIRSVHNREIMRFIQDHATAPEKIKVQLC
jgi:glutaredoxin